MMVVLAWESATERLRAALAPPSGLPVLSLDEVPVAIALLRSKLDDLERMVNEHRSEES